MHIIALKVNFKSSKNHNFKKNFVLFYNLLVLFANIDHVRAVSLLVKAFTGCKMPLN